MSFSKRIVINISGEIFETFEKTLKRFPETLLGSEKKRELYYLVSSQQYFFNRHRKSFDAILFFYQSWGILRCPPDVLLEVFEAECRFFEVPDDIINSMKLKAGVLSDLQESDDKNNDGSIRDRIWNFIENPGTSTAATVFTIFSLCTIVLSILLAIIETISTNHKSQTGKVVTWFLSELILNSWFLLELTIRFFVCPSKKEFILNSFNVIDGVAVLPYFMKMILAPESAVSLGFLRIFRLARIVRLFKFSKHSIRIQIVCEIISSSLGDIQLLLLCLGIFVTLAGSTIYYIEHSPKSDFNSIPQSIWWGIITITTVGYGDIYPMTPVGKVFAAGFMILGVLTMSLPVLSIVAKFELYYEKNIGKEKEQYEKEETLEETTEKVGERIECHDNIYSDDSEIVVSFISPSSVEMLDTSHNTIRKNSKGCYEGDERLPVLNNLTTSSTIGVDNCVFETEL